MRAPNPLPVADTVVGGTGNDVSVMLLSAGLGLPREREDLTTVGVELPGAGLPGVRVVPPMTSFVKVMRRVPLLVVKTPWGRSGKAFVLLLIIGPELAREMEIPFVVTDELAGGRETDGIVMAVESAVEVWTGIVGFAKEGAIEGWLTSGSLGVARGKEGFEGV